MGDRDPDQQTEIHNRIAGEIVRSIVEPPLEAGGEYSDVLVVLESVALGVMMVAVRPDNYDMACDLLVTALKRRLAEQRLAGTPAQGRA